MDLKTVIKANSGAARTTKAQLLTEVQRLRERVSQLESEADKHQHAEELMRDSERRSRAWLEPSPACTKIVDLDFNLQYMSNAGV